MSVTNVSPSNNVNFQCSVKNNSNVSSDSSFSDILKLNETDDETDTRIMNEINSESDPIEREEDIILYQKLKKARVDFKNHSLKWYKKNVKTLGFPQLTAPGYVRKAWREMLEKMPQQQKEQFEHNVAIIMCNLRYSNTELDQEMESSNFSYFNFVDKMLNRASNIKGIYGFNHLLVNDCLSKFKINMDANK